MLSTKNIINGNFTESLAVKLQKLMRSKNINEAELARRTNTPQPTLHKILTGKTEDPRTSTLKALTEFFEISIDELLTTINGKQKSESSTNQAVPVISWKESLQNCLSIRELNSTNWSNWTVCEFISKDIYALVSKPSMEPRFPRGTILIIDGALTPVDGDLIVVHYPNTEEATLREISTDGPNRLLLPINTYGEQSRVDENIKLLGVLVKSMFHYHDCT